MLETLPPIVGEALGSIRAGMDKTMLHHPDLEGVPTQVRVSSPAFEDGAALDARFTADGEGLSPPLAWSGAPAEAAATVIVVEDADSPTPAPIVHLLAWVEGGDGAVPAGAWGPRSGDDRTGHNSFHKRGWLPPDPPPGHGPHRYLFQVFAVDALPDFTEGVAHKADVLSALKDHVLAMGAVVGVYARP